MFRNRNLAVTALERQRAFGFSCALCGVILHSHGVPQAKEPSCASPASTDLPVADASVRLQESAAIRCNYPEAYKYLKAKRDRHPKEDALEDFTEWTTLGEQVYPPPPPAIPKPGHPVPEDTSKRVEKPPETEEEYVQRRC